MFFKLRETYFYNKPLFERSQFFMKRFAFTCHCIACKKNLPMESISMVHVTELLNKIANALTGKNKPNSNILFKELIQEGMFNKNINFATRKIMLEHLHQLIFMPYQLDYRNFFNNMVNRAYRFEQIFQNFSSQARTQYS